jgi:hypothetical protein
MSAAIDMADDGGQPLYSWYDVHAGARELVDQIKKSGATITGIVAIPKGGLVLGTILAHAFCVPLHIGHAPEPWMPTSFLAVDDNSITGGSLSPFAHYGMPCAVLVRHPNAPGIHPFYFAEESDEMYLFPWEAEGEQELRDVETIVAGETR